MAPAKTQERPWPKMMCPRTRQRNRTSLFIPMTQIIITQNREMKMENQYYIKLLKKDYIH